MNLSIYLKEYGHCSNDEKVIFNNLLTGARSPTECAFGRLKNRWAILTKKIDIKLQNIQKVTYSCFTLHNHFEVRDVKFNFGDIKSQAAEISNNTQGRSEGTSSVAFEVLIINCRIDSINRFYNKFRLIN